MNSNNILQQWTNNILQGKNDIVMQQESAVLNCKAYKLCPCLNRIINKYVNNIYIIESTFK